MNNMNNKLLCVYLSLYISEYHILYIYIYKSYMMLYYGKKKKRCRYYVTLKYKTWRSSLVG